MLPDELPEKLLFISAGSGITPIMSMLRSLDHRDALDDVVLLHSARDRRRRDLRRRAARARRASTTASRCTSSTPARTGRMAPGRPRRAVPGLARARGVRLRARRDARRARGALGARTATATACTWSASSPSSATARRARAARSSSLKSRLRGRVRRRHADPRRRRGGGARAALRLPRGHLPHLRRDAALRAARATCAPARSTGNEGETVRTCINAPEGPSRSSSEETHGQAGRRA